MTSTWAALHRGRSKSGQKRRFEGRQAVDLKLRFALLSRCAVRDRPLCNGLLLLSWLRSRSPIARFIERAIEEFQQ